MELLIATLVVRVGWSHFLSCADKVTMAVLAPICRHVCVKIFPAAVRVRADDNNMFCLVVVVGGVSCVCLIFLIIF